MTKLARPGCIRSSRALLASDFVSRSLFQIAADILEQILPGILFGVLLLHFHVLQLFLRVLQETVLFLPFAGDPDRSL